MTLDLKVDARASAWAAPGSHLNLVELGEPVGEPVINREKRDEQDAAAAERSKMELAQALG